MAAAAVVAVQVFVGKGVEERSLALRGVGECFGEVALLGGQPLRTASIRATKDTVRAHLP